MERTFTMRFLLILLLVVFAQHDMDKGDTPALYITNIWTPPTSDDGENFVYMNIENSSEHDLTLVEINSLVAAKAAVMSGDEVLENLPFAAGEGLMMEVDGTAIILTELGKNLEEGDAFILTLTFALDEGDTVDMIVGVPVLEESPEASPFVIVHAWVRPTLAEKTMEMTPEVTHAMHRTPVAAAEMGIGGVAGIFMRIINTGENDDSLISASSDVAMMVEIHETTMSGDIMRMRPVEAGIDLPAGEMIELKPGSYHIMLMNLKREIASGEAVLITLTFDSGITQTFAVPAYDRALMLIMSEH
jgi:copper(I)-binding protein